MKTGVLALFGVLIFTACEYKPYQKSDVFFERAQLEKDEALHEKNSLEWWYFTGHLKDKNSENTYGVEYVFFHTTPNGGKDYTLFNIALTDPQKKQFYYDYRFDVWPKRMKAELPIRLETKSNNLPNGSFKGAFGNYSLDGSMKDYPISFSLKTTPKKSVLMHGEEGYEQYGAVAKAGYFSYTRLNTEGIISINGENIEVEGNLWYDRQWNCMGVYNKNLAWDWMAVQFKEENIDLMLYMLHTFEDSTTTVFGGTLLFGEDDKRDIKSSDIEIEPLRYWYSQKSEIYYPVRWRVKIADYDIDFIVESVLENQELHLRFGLLSMHYWEGMSHALGTINGKKVRGNAYVEMTNRKLHGIPSILETDLQN